MCVGGANPCVWMGGVESLQQEPNVIRALDDQEQEKRAGARVGGFPGDQVGTSWGWPYPPSDSTG
jgi:hypothetical protein